MGSDIKKIGSQPRTRLRRPVIQNYNSEVLTAKSLSDNEIGRNLDQKNRKVALLVSVRDWDEARLVLSSPVDWLDLKDPNRGALGRPDFEVVQQVAEHLKSLQISNSVPSLQCSDSTPCSPYDCDGSPSHWSIAGGELLEWDATQHRPYLDALGHDGAIKWALAGCALQPDWPQRAAGMADQLPNRSQMILVHYADHSQCQAPSWKETLAVAINLKLRYLLIDTAFKNGINLLDHYPPVRLRSMISSAAEQGIGVAIAGSLSLEQLPIGQHVGAAWVGVRGAVCAAGQRSAPISLEKLLRAVAIVHASAKTKSESESTQR